MKSIIVAVFGLGLAVVAVPDPLITPRAELAPRQDDPALVGWVDAINGQCKLSFPTIHFQQHFSKP
jgi:hypothetical protein